MAEIKPIAGMERVKLSDVVPLSAPFTVFIFPTTFCNFKCAYCGHSLGLDKMKEKYNFSPENMDMNTFKNIINGLKQFEKKIKVISLTGHGEPLINSNICEMVKMIKEADIAERIEIISNGSLLTKEKADGLINAGLDILRISIQGVKDSKYKEICKSDVKFSEIVENLTYFYNNKKNSKLYVKVVDAALDSKEEEEIFYKTFDNIADRMFIEHVRPVYDGVEMTKNMEVSADRYGREHTHRDVCPLCFFMLGIFPNGDVEPCDTIYKPVVLGTVNEISLLDMWNGDKLKEFRKMHLLKNRYSNDKCRVCCAPDDVSHPEDELDSLSSEVIKRL